MKTDCSCPMAGYCERHKINKPHHLYMLCQHRQDYFDKWDRLANRPAMPYQPVQSKQQRSTQDHWKELHLYSFRESFWDELAAQHWFRAWTEKIPKLQCKCRKDWRELIENYPPDFSSADAFFIWTVNAHNEVNAKLGKPLMTHAEALAIYS